MKYKYLALTLILVASLNASEDTSTLQSLKDNVRAAAGTVATESKKAAGTIAAKAKDAADAVAGKAKAVADAVVGKSEKVVESAKATAHTATKKSTGYYAEFVKFIKDHTPEYKNTDGTIDKAKIAIHSAIVASLATTIILAKKLNLYGKAKDLVSKDEPAK